MTFLINRTYNVEAYGERYCIKILRLLNDERYLVEFIKHYNSKYHPSSTIGFQTDYHHSILDGWYRNYHRE